MSLWRRPRAGAAVEARILEALESLRPLLRIETIGIELVRFDHRTGLAVLRFEGDCPDCQMSAIQMRQGVEAHLRMRVPEIREIHAI
ncbi:MAG TPA: NifU family protein [Gemmatimonadaceae bacterium]|nr:NifU family protein [Gemmatimonadaceae bacterium]